MRRTSWPIVVALLWPVLATAAGCVGPLRGIMKATHEVDSTVSGAIGRIDEGVTEYREGRDPVPPLKDAKAKLQTVLTLTKQVREASTKLEEKTPAWHVFAKWGLILGVLALVVFLVVRFGLDQLIKPWLISLGALVPRITKTEAKLHAEALSNGHASQELRESVAARRTVDPAYDRAFRRAKEKKDVDIRGRPAGSNEARSRETSGRRR